LLDVDATEIAIAQRAAYIAKADLATQMVVEMTSLQGTMGREYALRGDYPPEVANAIYEHWLPRGAGDNPPESNPGMILAAADRLDSLVGLFAAGLEPKATADPYGLRRAALGLVHILVSKGRLVNLYRAVEQAAEVQPMPVEQETCRQVVEFIGGRLRSWLDEQDWQPDVITAVLAAQAANPYRALIGIRELSAWVKRDDWEPILDGFARCVRITRGESETFEVDPAALVEPEEKALYAAYQTAAAKLTDDDNVEGFLTAFEPVLPAITAFFDEVLVNAEDDKLRQNRLGLLQAISAMQHGRADMSQLSGF
jgi:glycyl-tRNA synthetase